MSKPISDSKSYTLEEIKAATDAIADEQVKNILLRGIESVESDPSLENLGDLQETFYLLRSSKNAKRLLNTLQVVRDDHTAELNNVLAIEQSIRGKGLQREYVQYLIEELGLDDDISVVGVVALEREQTDVDISDLVFTIATATLDQRRSAAMRALSEPLPDPEDENKLIEESIRRGWGEAMRGEVIPVDQLWEGIDD